MNANIDAVITWVDGSDQKWRQELDKYTFKRDGDSVSIQKFRDWDTLKYVFRGIEEFMPWIRKIHFVTYGHVPRWMDRNNPKLHIVTHEEIFEDSSLLPTFNSNAIEFNILNINDLAEKFIYFNDDMLVLQPTPTSRMFINGMPRDFLMQTIPRRGWVYYTFFSDVAWRHNLNNNVKLINRYFDKKNSIRNHKEHYYNKSYGKLGNLKNFISNRFKRYHYFEHYHQAQPFLKSVWREAIDACKDNVDMTIAQRFREKSGITAYLFRYWHLVSGRFVPIFEDDFTVYNLENLDVIDEICSMLVKGRYRFVCLNDESFKMNDKQFLVGKKRLSQTLSEILPSKSSYET